MVESASSSQLSCDNLTAGYPGRCVASGIQIASQPGHITVIAGPNGAGKSTLLKTAARQLKPLSGQVCLKGQNIWDMSPRQFARSVAYVPQSLELAQDLTVLELTMLGRNPHQPWWSWESGARDRTAVEHALKRTETWQLRSRQLSNLSGGEKQRAMIATALAQEPEFLMLDEPTSHLDFKHQLELANLLRDLKKDGLAIMIVLHDLNLIASLADRVLFIAQQESGNSTTVAMGSPEAVMTSANLRAVYQTPVRILPDPQTGSRIYLPDTNTQAMEA